MERLACISIAVGQGSLNHTPCRPIGLEKDQPEDSLLPLRSPGHTGLMPPLPWNEEASRFLNASCMLHVFTLPISVGFDPLIYFVLPAPSTHLEATEQKWRHCSQGGQRGRVGAGRRGPGSLLWLPCQQTPRSPRPWMPCADAPSRTHGEP